MTSQSSLLSARCGGVRLSRSTHFYRTTKFPSAFQRPKRFPTQLGALVLSQANVVENVFDDSVGCEDTCDFMSFIGFRSRYTTGQMLGRGSFGYVHEAIDKESDQTVAVKIFPKRVNEQELIRQWQMVRKEARLMQLFEDSQHVVNFKCQFEDAEHFYLVQELMKGETLSGFLRRNSPVNEELAAVIMFYVLSSIRTLHEKEICYGDIKPDNLMFVEPVKTGEDVISFMEKNPGQVPLKLIDLGCSEVVQNNRFINRKHGTPSFMSPECIMGLYRNETDVWSAGVLMYFILSGQLPFWKNSQEFHEQTPRQIFHSILTKEVDFGRHKQLENVSESAKDLIQKLIDKSSDSRVTAEQALQHDWFSIGILDKIRGSSAKEEVGAC